MANGRILPKPPVTWVLDVELSEAERVAYKAFFYRLKDGVITQAQLGLTAQDYAVFVNTASAMYDIFASQGVADY